jgi:methionyl-tRNA synthetase
MLMGADFKTPSRVNVHGFLTVDGEKMSKSRGTFISAREYLDHLDPEYLRYYYACKQNGSVDDVGLHLKDFCERVNTDLGNQFVNLGSRVIAFLHKNLGGRLSGVDPEGGEELLAAIEAAADEVAAHYEKVDFGRAMKLIISLAHQANQYVATRAPWVHAGKDPETARRICTTAINAFAKMGVMLSPVLPVLAARVDALMDRSSPGWDEIKVRCLDRPMKPFSPIFTKIDPDAVTRMVEAVKARSEAAAAPASAAPACTVEPLSPEVSFDAFAKVDLRVALILEAAEVPGADKLLKLRIDLGPLGTRQIFAGIRKSHQAAALVGRKIIVVANLAARKMKFGLSEGMLLAAGAGDKDIFLLGVEDPAKPGEKIH